MVTGRLCVYFNTIPLTNFLSVYMHVVLVVTIMVTKRPWIIFYYYIRLSDIIIFSSDVQRGMALRVDLILK